MSSRPHRVLKRRPKVFAGIHRQLMTLAGVNTCSPEVVPHLEDKPVPVEMASSKKLAISSLFQAKSSSALPGSISGEPNDDHSVREMKGYWLIRCEELSQAVIEIGVCSACGSSLTFQEDIVTIRGIVSKMSICSTNSECSKTTMISNPYDSDAKHLNARSILAMRAIGRGRSSLESFCGFMDMLPPVTSPSFIQHNQCLAMSSMNVASENMLAVSAHLHKLHDVEPTEVINVAVTCDGTWSKRGFTATHGIVTIIAWESGQVLDFEIKSKRCNVCARQKEGMDPEAFMEWWEGHQAFCGCDHFGSSPAIECEAATDLFL